jgi:ketosteroid isomerase-like protein
METNEPDDRLAALEERVRLLEDHVAVYRLICSWGAGADIGSGQAVAALWTDDAVLEFEATRVEGRSEISAMIDSDHQQSLVRQGCAHVQCLPVVRVTGDHAVATNYSQVFLHTDDDGFETWRVTANNWEFLRTTDGWRAARRTSHVIDGSPKARELLGSALGGSA